MSPLAGQARLICLEALRRGLVPPESRDRAVALLESLAADSPDPSVLVEEGLLRADQVESLARDLGADEAATETFAAAPAPATGRYVEEGVIAQGGMGEIVLCVDRDIRRPIAMKRMLADTASDSTRRARFIEEAQVTGQLEHPNIVPVHELRRRDDGSVYFTMKLVKGKSLAEILKEMKHAGKPPLGKGGFPPTPSPKPSAPATQKSLERGAGSNLSPEWFSPHLSLSELLQVFLKVCDGVAFAHSRGVIHRDLKPANIMVGDYGEVLVMDWGLAKIVKAVGRRPEAVGGEEAPLAPSGHASRVTGHDSSHASRVTRQESTPQIVSDRQDAAALQTLAGSMMGTPAYMSPEQAKGELDHIDARSDIWSLGAILYEILTLERAVAGETTYAILANVLKGHIVPPEERAPKRNVPRELSAIVMKCLHKNRAHRYRSVLDLKRDLALFLEGRSVSASPDTFAQAVVKLVKRNKPVSAAIAAAAVLLIAVTTAFIIRLASERDRALASERLAVSESKAAKEARDQQRATALAASKRQAESAVRAASEGRLDEAKVRADAAVEVMPDGPWGHYALGVLAHEKKDFASARKHLDEALRLDPTHRPSTLLHITILAATGDLAQFEKLAAEADKCNDWKALIAAGDTLFAARRHDAAVRAYTQALSLVRRLSSMPQAVQHGVEEKLERASACQKMAGFWGSVSKLPPDKRARLLSARLAEAYGTHPSCVRAAVAGDGSITLTLDGSDRIRWLDPLRGLSLTSISLYIVPVRDLEPLRGMPLRSFSYLRPGGVTGISDFGPLKGMPLDSLVLRGPDLTDLRQLVGLQLTKLLVSDARISDISPLKGMPLKELSLWENPIGNLSALAGMRLESVGLGKTNVTDLTPLRGMPLRELRPPAKRQLTAESLKVVEELEKQGCKVHWTE